MEMYDCSPVFQHLILLVVCKQSLTITFRQWRHDYHTRVTKLGFIVLADQSIN